MKLLIHALGVDQGGGMRHLIGLNKAIERDSELEVTWIVRDVIAARLGYLRARFLVVPNWVQNGVIGRFFFDLVLWRWWFACNDFDCVVALANTGPIVWNVPYVVLQRNALLFHHRTATLYPSTRQRIRLGVQRLLAKVVCRCASRVICPTADMAERTAAVTGTADRCRIVPHAISLDEYDGRLDAGVRQKISELGATVLFLGLGAAHKNLDVVLEAVASVQCVKQITLLVTLGEQDHAERERLLLRAGELGISNRVMSLGNIDGAQVKELFQHVDVVVNPPLVESFGFVALEGMAFGAAMVASDIGPNREICSDAVLYFNPDSAGELSECLLEMSRPEVNQEYRRRAAERFKEIHVTWSDYLKKLVAICVEAIQHERM